MRPRHLERAVIGLAAIAAALGLSPEGAPRAADVVDEGCPETSAPEDHAGASLQGFAAAGTGSVVYDTSTAKLRLKKEGGSFSSKFFTATGNPQYACAADFNKDGWQDFVGASSTGQQVGYYRNDTASNVPAVTDWANPAFTITPKFTLTPAATYFWTQATAMDGGGATACGDFNNDSNPDFAMVLETGNNGGVATLARLWRGNGNGTFQAPTNLNATFANDFYDLMWDGNMVPTDYDQDGWLDLVFGAYDAGGGYVRVFHNNGGAAPTFTASTYLKQNIGLGANGVNGIVLTDLTGDTVKDLAVVGKAGTQIKLFPGILAGGFGAVQNIASIAGQALLVGEDFSLDGKTDLVMGTDGAGGVVRYYKNNATGTPFSAGVTQTVSETFADFDTGFAFDYDNDPDHTQDFMFADGNGAGYATFANRTLATYVGCGDVASGVLDLGGLSSEEIVVTSARITPTMSTPTGTSITFYMSNELPESWQLASACTDDPSSYCVSFPHPVGRQVKWKASMCSDSPAHTKTPTLTSISAKFDYKVAEEHYRAGVVVDDGIAYIGAFRQPGDRGHFYAVNAGLNQTYWDAAIKLDAMADSSRSIYVATSDGADRLDFTVSEAGNAELQASLGGATEAQATSAIDWQRSARFGIGSSSIPMTRLGAIETSTPAVVGPPGKPSWYFHADSTLKAKVDTFITAHADRPTLALVGAKDGALHAFRSQPTNVTDATNGAEAWAFIPAHVAARLRADQASGTVTAYPDGSPSVADVVFSDDELHTVALVAAGNGGKAVFAIDITETVDETSGTTLGPDPLWQYTPGGAEAGQSYVKPVFARVRIAGATRHIVVVASGVDSLDATRGRHVVALDVETGAALWQFRTACPVTSDLLVFETDDELEPGEPPIDGYIDRVLFADQCGFVYKLDPAVELAPVAGEPGWRTSAGMASVDTGTVDGAGAPVYALFSTALTDDALGEARPIAGTVGAHPDSSGRMILFFGTGGIESYDPAEPNEFYAVYADDGSIRNKASGACSADGCEKYYGGVVVSSEQVIYTRAVDPPTATGTCSFGSSVIEAVDLNVDSDGNFTSEFSVATTSATVSALFGDAGAVYAATLSGEIVRVGTPRAEEAGGDTAAGVGQGEAPGDGGGGAGAPPLGVMGWRRVQ